MGKRGHNEGTVFQDASGAWWAQLPRDETGKRPRRKCKTQREALAKLREMTQERAAGRNLTIRAPIVTDYMTLWLDEVKKPSIKQKTYDSYTQLNRLYVVPEIGSYRLDKVTPALVQKLMNTLLARVSAHTALHVYRLLKQAFKLAVEWGYISRNPVMAVKQPRIAKHMVTPLTEAQALQLLDAAAGHRLEALYRVALSLGLREGEILGLRWADVDWQTHTLHISGAMQYSGKQLHRVSTKTETSARTLPLPDTLVSALRQHWQRQQAERLQRGTQWKEHGLIFASEVGTPIWPRNLLRQFKRLLKKAGLMDIRFHDIRHSAASLMLAQGIPLKVVSEILGHAGIQITADTYGHVFDTSKRAAVEHIDRIFDARKTAN